MAGSDPMAWLEDMWAPHVLEVAREFGVRCEIVSIEESPYLHDAIRSIYTHTSPQDWIWADLKDAVTFHHPFAYTLIPELVPDAPLMLGFDISVDATMLSFQSPQALVDVLGETYMDECYATNADAEFLLCMNHHQVLCASGTAAPSLQHFLDTRVDEWSAANPWPDTPDPDDEP